jgi:chemotaxis protein histidine kinase CheA
MTCPLEKPTGAEQWPRNAQLKEYIAAGVTKEEFMRRLKAALAPAELAPPQTQPATAPAGPSNQTTRSGDSSSTPDQASPPPPDESRVQALLAERAARLAEKKRKDEEEAKRQRAEKAKAKAEAEAAGLRKHDPQSQHAETLRKKQREAREERQRILKAIEDDKAARKARRAELEAERKKAENQNTTPFAPASQLFPSSGKLSEHCSLQVRLLDGSTIRSRFSSDETLKDVRQWVDSTRKDGKQPYTFKVLLTPLPSKRIDVTEESQSLRALELAPSSTLILVPVPKYTAAYSNPSSGAAEPQGNVFQRIIAYILAVITGFFGTVFAFFSTLFSTAGQQPAAAAASEPAVASTSQSRTGGGADAAPPTRRSGTRIAGLDHSEEKRRREQQYYNGNSVSIRYGLTACRRWQEAKLIIYRLTSSLIPMMVMKSRCNLDY